MENTLDNLLEQLQDIKWKYEISRVPIGTHDSHIITSELEKRGKDGWMLVQIVPMHDNPKEGWALFKKPRDKFGW